MDKVYDIINQIRNTSSTNGKLDILKSNRDNQLLQRVLEYTYNPYKVYHLSKKSLESKFTPKNSACNDIFDLLDYLQTNNRSQEVINNTLSFLDQVAYENEEEFYRNMILKDLRCGISSTTINKVWKDLIPTFGCMLAKSYADHGHKVTKDFSITQKFDGIRCVIIKENGIAQAFTRQGKLIEGLVEFTEDFIRMPNNTVFDGELLKVNTDNLSSKDLYQATKKITGKDGDKYNLEFHVFDMIPLDEFKQGQSKLNFVDRKHMLTKVLNAGTFYCIKLVPTLYYGSQVEFIDTYLNTALQNNQEGIMINLNKPYVCKRTDNILKVKVFNDCDLRITGWQEGDGKYVDMLGAFKVDYKGYSVYVGGGYKESERKLLWENRRELLNRVIKVKYFEETTNEKGELSLRFPTFLELCHEGKEVSYN